LVNNYQNDQKINASEELKICSGVIQFQIKIIRFIKQKLSPNELLKNCESFINNGYIPNQKNKTEF